MIEEYIPLLVAIVVGGIAGVVIGRVIDLLKAKVPYAEPVIHILSWPFRKYRNISLHISRRLTPDSFYKMWYRAGIMDESAYREFQERGYIKSDLDPEYIQQMEDQ